MEIDTASLDSIGRVDSKNRDEVAIDLSDFTDLIRVFVQFNGDSEVQWSIYDIMLKSFDYPLPIKRTKQVSEEERKIILKRVQHDCLETDKCYRILQKEHEQTTRCKSVRLSTGFYEYTDTDAGVVLDPQEYRARYDSSLRLSNHRHSFPLYNTYKTNRSQNKRNNLDDPEETLEIVSPRKHLKCFAAVDKNTFVAPLPDRSVTMEVDGDAFSSDSDMQIAP